MNKKSLGLKIKQLREEKGFTQEALVEKLLKKNVQITKNYLDEIENNKKSASAVELEAICKILDVEMDVLFNLKSFGLIKKLEKRKELNKKEANEAKRLQLFLDALFEQENIYKKRCKSSMQESLQEQSSGGKIDKIKITDILSEKREFSEDEAKLHQKLISKIFKKMGRKLFNIQKENEEN
ncbi:MAG: helix-turn-helix domain-containing protein [Candidatus Woesearchaeota archaeon]